MEQEHEKKAEYVATQEGQVNVPVIKPGKVYPEIKPKTSEEDTRDLMHECWDLSFSKSDVVDLNALPNIEDFNIL